MRNDTLALTLSLIAVLTFIIGMVAIADHFALVACPFVIIAVWWGQALIDDGGAL